MMFNKQQVQEALGRVDNAVAQLNGSRQMHVAIVNDMKMIQQCCMDYFDDENELNKLKEDVKDVRTDKSVEHPESDNKDS